MPVDIEFSRTKLLFGENTMARLADSHIAIFGIGGVGSYTVEALARSGIGFLDIIDSDKIESSNINRQLFALHSTIGQYKVDVAKSRIYDINPSCCVTAYKLFFSPDTAEQIDFTAYDYIADCIDTVSSKIEIITRAKAAGIPVISCMGAGNKLDPTQFEVADISKTSVCPLARVMRHELKNRGIENVKVVYSKEKVIKPLRIEETEKNESQGKRPPASNSFVPASAGLILAGEIIKAIACRQ